MKLTPDQIDAARACGCEFVPATPSEVQRLTMQRRIFQLGDQAVLATRNGSYFETIGTLTQMVEGHLRDMIQHVSEVGSEQASIPAALGDRAPVAESTSAVPAPAMVSEPNREIVPGNPPPAAAVSSGVMVSVEETLTTGVEATQEDGVGAGTPPQPKRSRGRPRKHPVLSSDDQKVLLSPGTPTPATIPPRTRGPGRAKREAGLALDEVEEPSADSEPASTNAASADALPDGDEVPAHQTPTSSRLPRVRGPKVPRWMTAGMARRGRLK